MDGGVQKAGRAVRPCSVEQLAPAVAMDMDAALARRPTGSTARMSGRGSPTVLDARDRDEVRISGLDWK